MLWDVAWAGTDKEKKKKTKIKKGIKGKNDSHFLEK